MTLAIAASVVLLSVGVHAQADEGGENGAASQTESDADRETGNPWVDGPAASKADPKSLTRTSAPPRRPGATVEVPTTPPVVPDEALPAFDIATETTAPVRLQSVLTREDLGRYGAHQLAQALTQLVGVEQLRVAPQTTLLGARGFGSHLVDIRIDGVPALTPSIFSGRSALSDVSLLDVSRVRVHHGPQAMLGVERGVGAVIDIETIDPPRELGESLPLHGDLVGGIGGPEALKTVQLRAEGGIGRIRGMLSGSVVDTDDIHLGRGVGLLPASSSQGGTLGARVDVTISRSFRVFGAWQSARQTRMPRPDLCAVSANGTATDCTRLFDVGRDALIAGADGAFPFPVLGARLSGSARAHAQRVMNDTDRFGSSLTFVERRQDSALRTGGLGHVRLTWPRLTVPAAPFFNGRPSLELGGEVRRDRVFSKSFIRSTRGADGDVTGLGLETPARRGAVDGTRVGLEAALMTLRFNGPRIQSHAKVKVGRDTVAIPPTPDFRVRVPETIEALTYGVDVAARVVVADAFETFASAQATRVSPQVDAVTLGPSLAEGQRVERATEDTTVTTLGGEVGGRLQLSWLTLDVVTYAYRSSGALRATETDTGPRLLQGLPRFGSGFELRGQWRTAIDGLTARGTLAAPLVDEGELFANDQLTLPFIGMTPADQVTGPFGDLALSYAPSDNWFSGFVRTRFVAPHTRLGPTERNEPQFCGGEEVPDTGGILPCLGAPGHINFDVGGRFAPTDAFAIDAVGENLLDLPFASRTGALPFGGIGVRLKLTIKI